MDRLVLVIDKIERYLTYLTSVMIILLTTVISCQIFFRYVLNTGVFWLQELSVIMMMWIVFLGASGAVWDNHHIGLNFIVESFPENITIWLRVLSDLIIAIFSIQFFNYGLTMTLETGGTLSALRIPIGYTYAIIPVTALLMALFAIVKLINRIRLYYYK